MAEPEPVFERQEYTEQRGRALLADCLDVLRDTPSRSVALIYIDPPFGLDKSRRYARIKTGTGDLTRRGFSDRRYSKKVISDMAYPDPLTTDEYVAHLRPRLEEMWRVLRDDGSIYVHLDFRSVHRVRNVMDDIFGDDDLLNEVIWAYDYGGRSRNKWPRKHDNILWYAQSDRWIFNREEIDRLPYMAPSLVGPEKAARGKLPTDVWWLTIVPTSSRERTGYPTQKPLGLLERIVRASSNEGDIVADFFAGSGTAAVAAKRLGRRYLAVDNNPDAFRIAVSRIQNVLPTIW